MRQVRVEMPLLAAVAVTRGMLGAGAALLLADRLKRRQRKKFGWLLFSAGAVSTVPLLAMVLCRCPEGE